jgi:hypothetical protein
MGYKLLLGFLLIVIGIGLFLFLFLFLIDYKYFNPLFIFCLCTFALTSLVAGIFILN